ncbi:MAG: protein-glutamate O-methyltransferase CheR [Planctomycetes bacterium]|nr:protein-glutamate O-methyltransferase CheR [Planctomycetota bacterium]
MAPTRSHDAGSGKRAPPGSIPLGRVAPQAAPALTEEDYTALRDIVFRATGISLGDARRQMLQARLVRRIRALGLSSFAEYLEHLRRHEGEETARFINAVTTNKTDFFREEHHFRFLAEEWLPEMRARAARTGERTLRIWSAACSSGQEPYSIALTLLEALRGETSDLDIRILASDIDTDVLAAAARGAYGKEQVAAVPPELLRRWFTRGEGPNAGLYCVREPARALVQFRQINLVAPRWPIRSPIDLVFCRNALIYFDQPEKEMTVCRFAAHLRAGGHLLLGHSESLRRGATPFRHVGNTIYQLAPAGQDEPSRGGRFTVHVGAAPAGGCGRRDHDPGTGR